ncbi:polysaccharide deacetylase family protein [Ramlibacter sp. AW1]|uniref:Polysaccharide deacetylase family protein n=1 Tax=Ramlibacter aurantiacus TaxID=2801330 RepID=A0A936ZSA9_9BURK|nr:polysaccharide deacetylase family protein [Ramlibacter aurantiacus]MBL0422725.1 polysaccharide deacetylase family protein [Ramlibacter aurantiacus]
MNETSSSLPFRPPIPILSYHQTDALPKRGVPFRSLVLPPARFARQMRALHRLGWRGVSLRELEPYLRGEKTGKVVGITLDDGYVNNYLHALPVLRELGFTATSFVVSRQVGGSNVWDRSIGVPDAPLMDLAQLRGWIDAGMEVGAHTCNHVDLPTCDAGRAHDEITHCKDELEHLLGCEVRSFCYPYGRYRPEHVEMARDAGYAMATSSDSRRAPAGSDLLCLPRISVWLSTPLPLLLAQVTTPFEEWRQHPSVRGTVRLRRWVGLGRGEVKPAAEHRPLPEHRSAATVRPRKPLA